MGLQRPVGRDRVEVHVGELDAAVHLPGDGGAVVVAPEDVGLAVPIEVANPLNVPTRRNGAQIEIGDLLPTIHLPQHGLPGVAIAPENVALAVTVEVTGPLQ